MPLSQQSGNQYYANEYMSLIRQYYPLAILAAGIAFTVGFHGVRRSYLQRTPLQVIGNLLFSSVITATMVVCTLCLIGYVVPDITPKVELGVAIFTGIFGVKGLDVIFRKKFGLSIVDLVDKNDIHMAAHETVSNLPDEDQHNMMDKCPLKNKCHSKCAYCSAKPEEISKENPEQNPKES